MLSDSALWALSSGYYVASKEPVSSDGSESQIRRVITLMRKNGFTIIELLVVIAIISILAAILFPVFAKAKGKAKQTACVSNLRQIGAATGMYMSDYDDLFPFAVDASDKYRPQIWAGFPDFKDKIPYMPMLHEALEPYTKSRKVFQCPADTGTQVLDTHFDLDFVSSPSAFATWGSSYLFRTEIAFKVFSQSALQIPAQINVYFDGAGHWHGSSRGLHQDDDFQTAMGLMHDFRYNVLFGDFHAKSLNIGEYQTAWSVQL